MVIRLISTNNTLAVSEVGDIANAVGRIRPERGPTPSLSGGRLQFVLLDLLFVQRIIMHIERCHQ